MPLSDNTYAALLMIASMAAFTLNDALMKLMSGQVPLFQLIFMRGVITTCAIGVVVWRMGHFRARIEWQDQGWVVLRTLAEAVATYFFLTALFNMPIANVTAILQALPLTITLAAAVFLGEPVGWRRMTAIFIGLIGVLLIIRPGAADFNAYSLYAIAAVISVTVRDLATRKLSSSVPSVLVVFANALFITLVFGALSMASPWSPVTSQIFGLTIAAAVLMVAAYLFSIMVMRVGEISFVAPFRYTGLLWAMLLGLVIFDEWPDAVTLAGATTVVASGLFTLYRDARSRAS
ncbi:MAG: DMT family transporter [Pseudomonadota bacterium]